MAIFSTLIMGMIRVEWDVEHKSGCGACASAGQSPPMWGLWFP